jgi:hypothetical protein
MSYTCKHHTIHRSTLYQACRTTRNTSCESPLNVSRPSSRTHDLTPSSQADDDDLDDLSFGGPASASRPLDPQSHSSSGTGQAPPTNVLGGRIGSTASGGRREDWGGLRTETRFTGESTLDEPVSVTIVSSYGRVGRHDLRLIRAGMEIHLSLFVGIDARLVFHLR